MDDNFLAGVVGVVEATGYERMCLYEAYYKRGSYTWEENLLGYAPTIGHVDDRPVVINLYTAIIDGHKILFVDACSQLVDWQMVDDWLYKNLCNTAVNHDGILNKVNAMNFHNVFSGL